MKNSQTLQHKLTQVKTTKVELKKPNSNMFLVLLTRHPLLLLMGLLVTCLGSATLAVYNLLHVSDVEKTPSESIPAVVEAPVTTNVNVSNPIPLWMIIAIAFSCASGCWVILRLVNLPKKPATSAITQTSSPRTRRTRVVKHRAKPQRVFTPIQPLQPLASIASSKKPVMTVLSPEHKHSIDRNKESLATLVDWRKHNSLSALLQKY
ncbi:MAG: hypothetical protein ACRAVC_08330 [Trichormus sp.]